ncbi:MAG: hypothetical protein CL955_01155 [Erythrobacteraceae bacterium]|jgi:hypothetical protein|nr:hypothetical protein [Erythrobacteraceae bacterium]
MARKSINRAEQLREHRKDFELALELGCTPAEAKAIRAQVEAREKHRAMLARHGRQSALPPLKMPTTQAEFERFNCSWMMRN